MSEELKPCPFCGGEAKIWQSGGSSEVDGYTTHHVVGCSKCVVSRQSYSKPYTGPKPEEAIPLAISLWNTRSEPSQARLSEAVKVLEAYFNEYEGVYDMAATKESPAHRSEGARAAEDAVRSFLTSLGKEDKQ